MQDPVTDIISGKGLEGIWDVVMSTNLGIENDRWLVPVLNVEEGGWKDLRVGKVEVVIGGGEVLRGDILAVAERLQVSFFYIIWFWEREAERRRLTRTEGS